MGFRRRGAPLRTGPRLAPTSAGRPGARKQARPPRARTRYGPLLSGHRPDATRDPRRRPRPAGVRSRPVPRSTRPTCADDPVPVRDGCTAGRSTLPGRDGPNAPSVLGGPSAPADPAGRKPRGCCPSSTRSTADPPRRTTHLRGLRRPDPPGRDPSLPSPIPPSPTTGSRHGRPVRHGRPGASRHGRRDTHPTCHPEQHGRRDAARHGRPGPALHGRRGLGSRSASHRGHLGPASRARPGSPVRSPAQPACRPAHRWAARDRPRSAPARTSGSARCPSSRRVPSRSRSTHPRRAQLRCRPTRTAPQSRQHRSAAPRSTSRRNRRSVPTYLRPPPTRYAVHARPRSGVTANQPPRSDRSPDLRLPTHVQAVAAAADRSIRPRARRPSYRCTPQVGLAPIVSSAGPLPGIPSTGQIVAGAVGARRSERPAGVSATTRASVPDRRTTCPR